MLAPHVVAEIRHRWEVNGEAMDKLAAEHGVAPSTLYRLRDRQGMGPEGEPRVRGV